MKPSEACAVNLAALRDLTEQALLELPRLPARVDREAPAALLSRVLALATRLADRSADDPAHQGLVEGAAAALDAATAVLLVASTPDATAELRATIEEAHAALGAFREAAVEAAVVAPVRAASPRGPQPLRAGLGAPSLHRLERPPLVPLVRVAAPGALEPRPRPRPPEDPAAAPLLAHLRALARDCFAELGHLGHLRLPAGGSPWTPALRAFEDRLLADLDAVAALGGRVVYDGAPSLQLDVLAELLVWADDAPCQDPARAFARAFVLGCMDGDDALRAALVALRQSPLDTHEAQRSALSLASSPAIERAMEGLAMGDDARLSAFALEVLRARGEGSMAVAPALAGHPDEQVRRGAALLLGASREREAARALLSGMLAVERAAPVVAAAAESLVRLGAREGLLAARAALAAGGPFEAAEEDLLRVVAVAGGPADATALVGALRARPSEATVQAVGWHGHPGSVEPLLDVFAEASPELWPSLAGALRRITGFEVEPSQAGAGMFAAWWAERWDRFGSADEQRLDGGLPCRYRFGQPHMQAATIEELKGVSSPAAREAAALELAVLTGGAVRLEPSGWVAAQLGALGAAREGLARRPGDWLERSLT